MINGEESILENQAIDLMDLLAEVKDELLKSFPEQLPRDGVIRGYMLDEDSEAETGFYVVGKSAWIFMFQGDGATVRKLDPDEFEATIAAHENPDGKVM